MGNGVSTDQENLPYHGIRDVSDAADKEQHDWSQLAEAPITEQPSVALWSPRKPYITNGIMAVSRTENIAVDGSGFPKVALASHVLPI